MVLLVREVVYGRDVGEKGMSRDEGREDGRRGQAVGEEQGERQGLYTRLHKLEEGGRVWELHAVRGATVDN